MVVEIIPWTIVSLFSAFFIYSACSEIRRRRRHGPPKDPRQAFTFDTAAPSYENPAAPSYENPAERKSAAGIKAAKTGKPGRKTPPVNTEDNRK